MLNVLAAPQALEDAGQLFTVVRWHDQRDRLSDDLLGQVWDTTTGRELRRFDIHAAIPGASANRRPLTSQYSIGKPLALSSDGKRFAVVGADGHIHLLDLTSGKYLKKVGDPSSTAPVIVRLHPLTPEKTENVAFALNGLIDEQNVYWVRVRLPVLPNGTTGWIPAEPTSSALKRDSRKSPWRYGWRTTPHRYCASSRTASAMPRQWRWNRFGG